MERVAVLPAQQQLGHDTFAYHAGDAPLTGDGGVVTQMPGEVVAEALRTAVLLPDSLGLEAVVVEDEDATGALAVGGAERGDVDPVGPTVHGVRRA